MNDSRSAHRADSSYGEVGAPRQKSWPIIGVLAGVVGGVADLTATVGLQVSMGTPAIRVLQAIASGLLGKAAFAGGIGSAAIGFALHFGISIICGIAFATVAARYAFPGRRPWIAGSCLGIFVYLVMRYVVLPLSPVAFPLSNKPAAVAVSVLFHVFAFGIPIALVAAHLERKMSRRIGLAA